MAHRGFGIVAVLLLLALSACGVKGDLVQKGKPLPTAPGAPMVQQQGGDALLSWTLPTVNQDGTPLVNLERFIIIRLAYKPGDYCDECRDPETGQTQVYIDRPEPAIRIGDRFYLRDPDLPLNNGYRYRIIAITAGDKPGPGALTHRVMLTPPQPPTGVQVTTHDRSLRIDWNIGTDPQEGELLGVNIYRVAGDAPFGPLPINNQPISEEHHDDFNLVNEQPYRYRLRSVIKVDNQIIESALSETVTATPRPEF